jgi:hypothetical protein
LYYIERHLLYVGRRSNVERHLKSMSAAARPKHWGVSLQAKGREVNPTGVELSTLPT